MPASSALALNGCGAGAGPPFSGVSACCFEFPPRPAATRRSSVVYRCRLVPDDIQAAGNERGSSDRGTDEQCPLTGRMRGGSAAVPAGAGRTAAAATVGTGQTRPVDSALSWLARAWANWLQLAKRLFGSLANPMLIAASSRASSARRSLSAGASPWRWRLITATGFSCAYSGSPVRRWYAVAASAYRQHAVECISHQLFRGGVSNGANGQVGGRQPLRVGDRSRDPEIGQIDTPLPVAVGVAEQEVGWLHIAVQQTSSWA